MGTNEEINTLVRNRAQKEATPAPAAATLDPMPARTSGDSTSKTCDLL
jgi:hypothetical protein